MFRTVIIGAGIAGVQAALELRQQGYLGSITLISQETEEPYDRPPLSKDFLSGKTERETLGILSQKVAAERSIDLLLGKKVTQIRRTDRQIVLNDDTVLDYDRLVLATGSRNRQLPVPGADAEGVRSLRLLEDAIGLRVALEEAQNLVIVGAGFIGLEVAAAARAQGKNVTVVEFSPRVMARVLSPEMSQHFAEEHARNQVRVLTEVGVTSVLTDDEGAARGVTLSDDSEIPADLVVIGVGAIPTAELATESGLTTTDGVVIDEQLRTSDPAIYAIGDCARFHCAVSGQELRLESIQNAADQARFVAARIARESISQEPSPSKTTGYTALPWFWTEQFSLKLQIAGVAPDESDSVVRGDPTSGRFSICRFADDRLVCVESVNQPRDHLAARKLLAAGDEVLAQVTREKSGRCICATQGAVRAGESFD